MENNKLRKPEKVIINGKKLSDILIDHLHWLREDVDGWDKMWADLRWVDLRWADLSKANLSKANLSKANLSKANLSKANLSEANLRGANLKGVDLSMAGLSDANLKEADLRYADLDDAILIGANLSNATLPDNFYYPMVCPEKGSFIGYKKVLSTGHLSYWTYYIVELSIPEDALRSSATTNKCRCNKAKVLGVYDLDHNKLDNNTIAYSYYDSDFKYEVGKEVSVSKFDTNRWDECSFGIHFFMNFKEAVDYELL